jgi:hypothetical protein
MHKRVHRQAKISRTFFSFHFIPIPSHPAVFWAVPNIGWHTPSPILKPHVLFSYYLSSLHIFRSKVPQNRLKAAAEFANNPPKCFLSPLLLGQKKWEEEAYTASGLDPGPQANSAADEMMSDDDDERNECKDRGEGILAKCFISPPLLPFLHFRLQFLRRMSLVKRSRQ